MTVGRLRIPIGLLVAVVVLVILGAVSGPVIDSFPPPEDTGAIVLLKAVPFILFFVAIVLAFIAVIVMVANVLNNNVPMHVYRPIETAIIIGIVLGVLGMFQPWLHTIYRIGFHLLLLSTLAFMVWSHVIPKGARRQEEIGSVSISELDSGSGD